VLESSEGPDAMLQRHQVLADAIKSGRLDITIFERTVNRLDALRDQFEIGRVPESAIDVETIRQAAQAIAIQTLRTSSGTPVPLVSNDPGTVIIAFARLRNLEVVDRFDLPAVMEEAIRARLPKAQILTISSEPLNDEIAQAIALAAAAKTVVVCTRDAIQHTYQQDIGSQILAHAPAEAKTIHVNLRGPYDVGLLGDVDETVFTFGDAVVSLRALASALAGN
jgi:hypothetical protein